MIVTVMMEPWTSTEFDGLVIRLTRWLTKYHIFAVIDYGYEEVFIFDPSITGLRIQPVYRATVDNLCGSGRIVDTVEVTCGTMVRARFHWFEPLTCVTMVKRLVGLNDWRVWTPRQLMKRLKDG